MDEILRKLSDFPKGKLVQDADQTISSSLYILHEMMMESSEAFSKDLEEILLNLIVANERQLSPVTANAIGICLLAYFKSQKSPDYWKFLSLMTEEIKQYNLVAIVVLGILSKGVGSSFKAQLSSHITTLSNSPNPSQFPYICQCFRRILLGTGDFLIRSIPQIFVFIKRCVAATAESLRNQAIKTLPVLLTHAKIDIQKILPVINPTLYTDSNSSRYVIAKSLAKLLYKSSNDDINYITKHYLIFLQNEKNVNTICSSMFTAFRFFEPIYIVSKLKAISKFIFNVSTLKLGIQSMVTVTQSILKAVFSVAGSTCGKSICTYLVEMIPEGKITIPNALVLVTALHNCEVPHKVLQQGLRITYTLLECQISEVRNAAVACFGSLVSKDPKTANVFLETFLVLILDANEHGLLGYANTIAMLTNAKNAQKVQQVCIRLMTGGTIDSPKVHAAFAIASALISVGHVNDEFIQLADRLIMSMKAISRPSQQQKRGIKYIAAYLVAGKENASIAKCIPHFITNVLQVLPTLSGASTFCLWSLIPMMQINEQLAQLLISAAITVISSMFSIENFDIDTVITPFTDDIDLTSLIYNSKNSSNISSLFTTHLKLSGSNNRAGACRAVIEAFPHIIRRAKKDSITSLIDSLFVGTSDSIIAGRLMLVRSLLQKKATFGFLPNDTLPKLLVIRTSSVSVKRIAASCVSRFLSFYPVLVGPTLDTMEKSKKSLDFTALTLADGASVFCQNNAGQRVLKLAEDAANSSQSSEAIFAISQAIKSGAGDKESQISLLKRILFGGRISTASEISQFISCLSVVSKDDKEFMKACVNCMLNFHTMRGVVQLLSEKILEASNYTANCLSDKLNLMTAPAFFANALHFTCPQEIIPMTFMLQQQLSSRRVSDLIINVFETHPDVKTWTDLCKRVILNMCVPPAERKGEFRVAPTRAVMVSSMQVAALLAHHVRQGFPAGLPCVDDIVSIAFNAVQMKDTKIDSHAFAIGSSIIREFSDVANSDGPFLALFTAQFHPMLLHALEEQRKFISVAEFVLDYLSFLKPPLLHDAAELVSQRVAKLKITKQNAVTLARVTSQLIESSQKSNDSIISLFVNSSNDVMNMLLRQELKITDIGNQLLPFSRCILTHNSSMSRPLILLIFAQFDSIQRDLGLGVCSECAKKGLLNPDDISFIIPRASIIPKSRVSVETFNAFEAEIDENAYRIISPAESTAPSDFLTAAAASATGKSFSGVRSQILAIASENQVFSALANVVKNAADDNGILPPIFDAACKSNTESAKAILTIVAANASLAVIDGILEHTAKTYKLEICQDAMRILLKRCSNTALRSLKSVADRVKIELLPTGVTFLCNLLSCSETSQIAVEICKLGALEYLEDILDIKNVPRVLHFLRLLVKAAPDVAPGAAALCLSCLEMIAEIADRQKVVSVATALLSEIPHDVAQKAYNDFSGKEAIIKCLTPPKKVAPTLKLISFGTGNSRRSSERGGWQTLTVGDDDDV